MAAEDPTSPVTFVDATPDQAPGAGALAGALRRASGDGTVVMMAGTIVGGLTAYAWQAMGTRTLGEVTFAPVANAWTIMFLVVTILLAPVEQYATRTVAEGWAGRAHLRRSFRSLARMGAGATVLVSAVAFLLRDSLFDGVWGYALICGAIVLGFGQLALCRGILAGERKFAGYGWITGLDGIVRVVVALPLLLAFDDALLFAATIPVSTVVALFWVREWPTREEGEAAGPEGIPVGRFIATTVGGTSAAQVIVAGGPLILALMGGSKAAVSSLFITQTAFRGAFLVATPGWARVLPVLTGIHLRDEHWRLTRIAELILAGSAAVAAATGFAAAIVGPPLIGLLFGEGVRPSALVAGLLAAGTVLAIGNLGLNQVLIARVQTHRITAAWWVALGAMLFWLVAGPGTAADRVAPGFVIGEAVALILLTVASSSRLAPSSVRRAVYRARDRRVRRRAR
ncbi:MAG: lipopolysaccharide biosynthesis protein [Solirubrobacteraceae bacterium]